MGAWKNMILLSVNLKKKNWCCEIEEYVSVSDALFCSLSCVTAVTYYRQAVQLDPDVEFKASQNPAPIRESKSTSR